MSVESGSLVYVSPEERIRHLEERFRGAVDLTLIYDFHGDATDAERSVDYVEPNSLVFVEGYRDNGGQVGFDEVLNLLNTIRIKDGKNSDSYEAVKSKILELLLSEAMTPAYSDYDFSQYKCRQLQLLLEKDCIVYYADYFHPSGSHDPMQERDHGEFMSVSSRYNEDSSYEHIKSGNIAKAILSVRNDLIDKFFLHTQRERRAAFKVIAITAHVVDEAGVDSGINITSDQKLKTYAIYGSAHAKSLTDYFLCAGVTPDVNIVSPMAEHEYIDDNPDIFYEDLRRKIGFRMFSSLMFQYLNVEGYNATKETVYNNLANLNKDDQVALKFFVQCAQAIQAAEDNWDQGWVVDFVNSMLNSRL